MNNKLFCLALCSLFCLSSFAQPKIHQSPITDALELTKYLDNTGYFKPAKKDSFMAILSKYFDTQIQDVYGFAKRERNPFTANFFQPGTTYSADEDFKLLGSYQGYAKSLPGGIGGLEIPNAVLLGIADFIVKRTKQELSIAFFDNFKQKLESKEFVDLQTVFPQTYTTLQAIGDQIYQYPAYLKGLQSAFRADLDVLDENLPSIINNHPAFWNSHPEWKATLESSFYLFGEIKNKNHPGQILRDYPVNYLDPLNKNWKAAIQTLQLFSESLRNDSVSEDNSYWVNAKQVRKVITNPKSFSIYLGLLYQQIKINYPNGIVFTNAKGDTTTLLSIIGKLSPIADTLRAYGNFISQMAERTDKLNALIKNNNEPTTDSAKFQQYYAYYSATLSLLKQAATISQLPYVRNVVPNLPASLKDYFDVAAATGYLVLDVKSKNYSGAIVQASIIYDIVKAKPASQKTDSSNHPNNIVSNIAQTNTLTPEEVKGIEATKNSLLKYGSFMAAVSIAKTPADVQNAIEAIALPVGSARIKRESEWNIALNAYCGLYGGAEKIKGVDDGYKMNAYGITAPIGFAFSYGGIKHNPKHGGKSISLFLSLVDLGAVTAFRFSNDSASKVPSVQLKDIVSPGLFLSYGLGKVPVSLNFGYQVGPLLRSVSLAENKYEKKYDRWSFSICVDLPLLNLYTKSKRGD
jgi:hypothetical protein